MTTCLKKIVSETEVKVKQGNAHPGRSPENCVQDKTSNISAQQRKQLDKNITLISIYLYKMDSFLSLLWEFFF